MIRRTLVLIVIAALCAGCSGRSKSKDELLSEGMKLMQENNPGGAIVLFKKALEKDQNFFDARFRLAQAYRYTGKLDGAEKELLKVIKQSPSFREANLELARVYLQKGEPDNSLKHIRESISDAGADADALEITGRALGEKGDYPAAVATLRKALDRNPEQMTAVLALARTYAKMNRLDDARALIAELLKKKPNDAFSLHMLAELQIQGSDLEGALKTYDDILKTYPGNLEAAFKKGILYIEKGSPDEAIGIAETIIRTFPKRAEGYRLKGIALFQKKNLTDAIISLQESLARQGHVATYYFLGVAHYSRQEFEQAMDHLQKAAELNPALSQARLLRAVIFLRKNRSDDAIAEIRKVLERNEKHALAHNILGSAFMTKALYSEGLQELNRATQLDPTLVDAHIKKGILELSKGRYKEAETDLRTAVQVNPEMLYSRVILASYYRNNGEYAKAIEILNKGIQGRKEDSALYNLMAEIYLQQNNIANAVTLMEKAKKANPDYDAPYFNLAAVYFFRNEHDKGIQELRNLVERQKDNHGALVTLASVYEKKEKPDEARKYFMLAKDTGKTEGYIELAKYHARKNETDREMQVLDEGIKKNPRDIRLYDQKGKRLLVLKKFPDALKTFEEMEKIQPKAALPFIVGTYQAMNKPDRALEKINKTMKKDGESPNLMVEICRVYWSMGKKAEAFEQAQTVIRKYPQSPLGYKALASLYRDNKELDRAIDTLRKAGQLKDPDLAVMLAELLMQKKDYAAALELSRKAENTNPGYIPAMFETGVILHASGKKKEAALQYEKVLRLSPNHAQTMNNLAYLYAEDKADLSRALHLATRASLMAPREGFVQDTLGLVYLKQGKHQEALAAFKRAAELTPDNPTIHYHLALALKEQGKKAQSLEHLQKALSLGDFPEASLAKELLSNLKKEGRG